ncbi:helicase-like transcription factor CHR28 isoform X1 [Typha latifolia]|uniref:helicase-like transcription factor CHR28 isoform X1 n=1 Tax=Typha latifolia TaxID=4733 RepID=UPI003C2E9C8F
MISYPLVADMDIIEIDSSDSEDDIEIGHDELIGTPFNDATSKGLTGQNSFSNVKHQVNPSLNVTKRTSSTSHASLAPTMNPDMSPASFRAGEPSTYETLLRAREGEPSIIPYHSPIHPEGNESSIAQYDIYGSELNENGVLSGTNFDSDAISTEWGRNARPSSPSQRRNLPLSFHSAAFKPSLEHTVVSHEGPASNFEQNGHRPLRPDRGYETNQDGSYQRGSQAHNFRGTVHDSGSTTLLHHQIADGGKKDNDFDMYKNNGKHRILPSIPSSLTNDMAVENTQPKASIGFRVGTNAPEYNGTLHDSARTITSDIKVDTKGKKNNEFSLYENKDKQRILPLSFMNGRTVGSTRSKVSMDSRRSSNSFASSSNYVGSNAAVSVQNFPSSSLDNGQFTGLDETRREGEFHVKSTTSGAKSANGVQKFPFSSSMHLHRKPYKASTESSDDEIHVYGNASSFRVLPTSVTSGKSANGLQLAGSTDPQSRAILGEDKHIDYDERVIYQEALQNLGQPKLEDDLPEGLLSVSLLKHQKIALAWMVQKEKSVHCAGGILADDQGLGKTISMIALIQKQRAQQSKFTSGDSNHVKSEAFNLDEDDDGDSVVDKTKEMVKNESKKEIEASEVDKRKQTVKNEPKRETVASSHMTKPAAGTLVVCPASVLKQWACELGEKVTESGRLSVLVYHGGSRTKNPSDLAKYDVVVTTYTIVTNEVPKQATAADDEAEHKNLDKYGLCSEFSPNKKRKPVSNSHSKAKKKGKKLKDSNFDYNSGPLARVRWFRVVLDEAQTIKNHRTQVAKACCGLRAKRRWCLSGTPIQNAIDDLYSYFRFLKYDPYAVYSSFCASIKYPISRNATIGYKKLQAVLRTVLLRRTKDTLIDGEPIINLPPKSICLEKVEFSTEERAFYMKLEAHSRQQFKEYAAAGTVKQNYANILLLLLRLRQACDHPLLAKGYQSDNVGRDSLEMARQLPRKTLVDMLNQLEGSSAICCICSDRPEDAVVTLCGHVFCYQCVFGRLTADENLCPASGCRDILSTDSVFSQATLRSCISDNLDSNATTSSAYNEESSIDQSSYISSKIRAAIDILNSICNTYPRIDPKECSREDSVPVRTHNLTADGSDSGLDAINNSCQQLSLTTEIPVKAIVFSQWTSMLDLLELSLNSSLIQYRRLDGTMSLNSRDRAVKDFNTDPEVRVMIMSLKAGNLGLNMVAACHVILLDLWWNPYAEDQAVDRAHRIGQTRPVTVSRLTIQDTVEDRILALQEEKRKMVSSAFGEQSGGHATRLTVEDLRYLFMV